MNQVDFQNVQNKSKTPNYFLKKQNTFFIQKKGNIPKIFLLQEYKEEEISGTKVLKKSEREGAGRRNTNDTKKKCN